MTQTSPKPIFNPPADFSSNSRFAADPFAIEPDPCALCLAAAGQPKSDPNLSSLLGTAPNPIRMLKPVDEGDFFCVMAGIQVGIVPSMSVYSLTCPIH